MINALCSEFSVVLPNSSVKKCFFFFVCVMCMYIRRVGFISAGQDRTRLRNKLQAYITDL
jgi:hypothetical protein